MALGGQEANLESGGAVELDEELADHGGEVGDDLLPMLLDSDGGRVATGMRVHGADDGGDGRLLAVT